MKKELVAHAVVALVVIASAVNPAHAEDPPAYCNAYPAFMDSIGDHKGVSVDTDSQHNVYVATTSVATNGSITKYGPNGQFIWSVEFAPGPKNPSTGSACYETEGISAIAVHPNGYIYATGEVFSEETGIDCALKKLDGDGNLIWTQTYDGNVVNGYPPDPARNDLCHDIAIGPDQKVYTVGLTGGTSGHVATFLRWTPFHGLIINGNQAIKPSSQATDLALSDDGYAYVLVKPEYGQNGYDVFQLEAATGYVFDGGVYMQDGFLAYDIAVNANGDVFVGGAESIEVNHGTPEEPDIRVEMAHSLKKFALEQGDLVPDCEDIETYEITYYGYDQYDHIWALTIDANGNPVAAGSDFFAGYNRHMAMAYDKDDCSQLWSEPLTETVSEGGQRAFDIVVDSANNIIMTGVEGTSDYAVKLGSACESYTDMSACWAAFCGCQWIGSPSQGVCVEGT